MLELQYIYYYAVGMVLIFPEKVMREELFSYNFDSGTQAQGIQKMLEHWNCRLFILLFVCSFGRTVMCSFLYLFSETFLLPFNCSFSFSFYVSPPL